MGKLRWPLPPSYTNVTSPFGKRRHPVTGKIDFHNGIDIAAPQRTPVLAPADGLVTRVWFDTDGGGQSVFIRHDNGYRTGYAHLDEVTVFAGQRIRAGQVIGYVGQTGKTTGSHLHFTVRGTRGERIDPLSVVRRPV